MPFPEFEYLLAEHCAPTLLSQKCASLVSLSGQRFPDLSFLHGYQSYLESLGISSRILCRCGKRTLLFLYRRAQLQTALSDPTASALLRGIGYPDTTDPEQLFPMLEQRLRHANGAFPHEIGIFLGYPPDDVDAFMRFGGKGFRLCGYWKVYHDTETARRCFACYDSCRKFLSEGLKKGLPISALLPAA